MNKPQQGLIAAKSTSRSCPFCFAALRPGIRLASSGANCVEEPLREFLVNSGTEMSSAIDAFDSPCTRWDWTPFLGTLRMVIRMLSLGCVAFLIAKRRPGGLKWCQTTSNLCCHWSMVCWCSFWSQPGLKAMVFMEVYSTNSHFRGRGPLNKLGVSMPHSCHTFQLSP